MAIRFFEKNKIDLSKGDLVTITVTDAVADDAGQDFVDYMRNRKNESGWATTNSTDAANTQLDVDFGESHEIDSIFLVGINWKAYTIQYWNGSTYVDFSTAISETTNSDVVKLHEFNDVETQKIRIIITGTMVVDADKVCAQLIVTQAIGTFTMQPRLKDPQPSKNKKYLKALSGKGALLRSTGAFSVKMSQPAVKNETDLALIESLNDYFEGFLMWLCGGDESQFQPGARIGFRKEDIYLVNIINEWQSEYHNGFYKQGVDVDLNLSEVI